MNARPTERGKTWRPTGKARRREVPREGHTNQAGGAATRETANRTTPHPLVGADSISARGPCGGAGSRGRDLRPKSRRCAAVGLRNAPAGAVNLAPTNKFYVLGQPGRPRPRVVATSVGDDACIGPGTLRRCERLRADMESAPTNLPKRPVKPDGRGRPGGRRAGCPYPAGPCGGADTRGRIWNPPLRPAARRMAKRETTTLRHCKPV